MSISRVRSAGAALFVVLAAGLALLAAGDSAAQRIQRYEPDRPAGVAGRFDYYVLSLSWSPTYCAEQARAADDDQCRPRRERPFAFVLHGLWPQYERGFPEFCATRERPFVPQSVIDRMLDVMPARALIIHEYRKHGTCSGLDPNTYFAAARRLYEAVKIPQRFVNTDRDLVVEKQAVVDEFVAANPGLRPEHVAVTCGGAGNRLREVRICLTREGAFRPCGGNENPDRLCRSPRVYMPPVRYGGTRPDRAPLSPRPGEGILPGPVAPGVRNL